MKYELGAKDLRQVNDVFTKGMKHFDRLNNPIVIKEFCLPLTLKDTVWHTLCMIIASWQTDDNSGSKSECSGTLFEPINVLWIKIDQLDVTWFIISLFTAQQVSNVSTSIFRSLRLVVDLFHPYAGWSTASACIRIPHHPSRTTP